MLEFGAVSSPVINTTSTTTTTTSWVGDTRSEGGGSGDMRKEATMTSAPATNVSGSPLAQSSSDEIENIEEDTVPPIVFSPPCLPAPPTLPTSSLFPHPLPRTPNRLPPVAATGSKIQTVFDSNGVFTISTATTTVGSSGGSINSRPQSVISQQPLTILPHSTTSTNHDPRNNNHSKDDLITLSSLGSGKSRVHAGMKVENSKQDGTVNNKVSEDKNGIKLHPIPIAQSIFIIIVIIIVVVVTKVL